MEKNKFYIKNKKVYMLIEEKPIDNKYYYVKIGEVLAIFIDRVIFSNVLEYITDNKQNIYKGYSLISLQEAKKKVENSKALLDKFIFRR